MASFTGLSAQEAEAYVREHGYNEIVEKKESLAAAILRRSVSPISGMLLVAALLSFASGKTFDGSFILVLLILNIGITVWQERKADTAIEELNKHLAIEVKALRDGAWRAVPSRELAVRDVIELHAGSVVPADARALEAEGASANEAALTGESLPQEKAAGDPLYSGSIVASGIITAEVTATGGATRFGRVLAQTGGERKKSSLEADILRISRALIALSLAAVAALTAVLLAHHAPLIEILRLDLSLVIAGVPISLPTVMTLIIALGVLELARKSVIVRRLSALEDLANTNFLLTDKTGTLTENNIRVHSIIAYAPATEAEVAAAGALIAAYEPDNVINRAIARSASAPASPISGARYLPGDSVRKRSTLTAPQDGAERTLSLGAPQVIASLCEMADPERRQFERDVEEAAQRGYRTLALAAAPGAEERAMRLQGLYLLADTLRPDAADVVAFLRDNGIGVAMVTGDNRAIAREVSESLHLPGERVVAREELLAHGWDRLTAQSFAETRAFAEILPEDKWQLVKAAKKFFLVASNGDGINDLPAVREANVGFAVGSAVDALKGAADIVLISDGIAVMRDAFIEGRKIFARLYAYSLYRISESFRLIVTIAVLGFLTGTYPLSVLQLILLALLNDVPIISLALNRVRIAHRPASINVREQFTVSLLFGLVGIVESLLLYFVAIRYLRLPPGQVETLFFLKLTVSGHLLIYVAHTRERWWRYLPSGAVIFATAATQAIATLLALSGFLMPAAISWPLAALVWAWALCFMQLNEFPKLLRDRLRKGVE